jgi:hypothetical protein
MAQDSGVSSGSAFTGGNDVFEGWSATEQYKSWPSQYSSTKKWVLEEIKLQLRRGSKGFRYRGCGIRGGHYGGLRLMEPKILRVGEYFINLGNLLWAQATRSATDPDVQVLLLTFGAGEPPLQLTLSDSDATKLIDLLDSMSQGLWTASTQTKSPNCTEQKLVTLWGEREYNWTRPMYSEG